jgi:hypothetical protein
MMWRAESPSLPGDSASPADRVLEGVMPRYIAVHPGSFAEKDLAGLAQRRGEMPEGVTWLCTWCGTAEDVTYCDWEAPSAQAIQDVLTGFQVPVDAIREVRYFEPDAGRFTA